MIRQELDDQAGLAHSLHALDLLAEQEENPLEAVALLARAQVLFNPIGTPQQEQARPDLAHLEQKLGAATFAPALATAGQALLGKSYLPAHTRPCLLRPPAIPNQAFQRCYSQLLPVLQVAHHNQISLNGY